MSTSTPAPVSAQGSQVSNLFAWQWGAKCPSLHPGSKSLYLGACIRSLGDSLRLHIPPKHEHTFEATAALCQWIQARPENWASFTKTNYVRCLIRAQGDLVRVQIPGPEFNRPWGVEFEHPVSDTAPGETEVAFKSAPVAVGVTMADMAFQPAQLTQVQETPEPSIPTPVFNLLGHGKSFQLLLEAKKALLKQGIDPTKEPAP